MRKSVGLLISLVGILGGITVYVWYDTRIHLKHLIATIKPFAEVRYSYIYASPLGSAGIKGLEILPYGADDKFLIDKVGLQEKNLFSLLTINRALEQGQLPKSMHLVIEDVQIPLDSRLLRNRLGEPSLQLPFEFTRCGEVVALSATEFQALGYDTFHLDLGLVYNINELTPSMQLIMKLNHHAMLATTTEAHLTLPQPMLSLTDLVTLSPNLIDLTVTLIDRSLVERLNRFCSEKETMSVSAYRDEQIRYLQNLLQAQGILFNPNLKTLYKEFLMQGGQIKITASPQRALPLRELMKQNLKDTLDLLHLAITVNNLPITELSLEFHKSETFSYSKKAVTSDTIRSHKQHNNAFKYRSIAYEEIPDYLGSMAIIHTVNGSQHKGKLEAIDQNTIRLAKQMRGGSVAFSINIYEIKKVLVAP
jgi:hypothetical protein